MIGKNGETVVIFGPTASGKTALAIEMARQVGGEIINADSRQVYKFMPLLNACPTAEEYAAAPHHLFEMIAPSERFSAGKWAALAREKIAEVRGRGKVPIVVGGTGFYLRVLMEGMDEIPDVGEEIEERFAGRDVRELHAELKEVDAELAAKLKPTDTQRIVRGLAVFHGTGKPLSAWQAGGLRREREAGFVKIGVMPERNELKKRIALRWAQMVEKGLVDEVRVLREKGFAAEMPGLKGLAIPLWFAHAAGEVPLERALEAAIVEDRRYAKRQYTWLRNSYGADVVLEKADIKLLNL